MRRMRLSTYKGLSLNKRFLVENTTISGLLHKIVNNIIFNFNFLKLIKKKENIECNNKYYYKITNIEFDDGSE